MANEIQTISFNHPPTAGMWTATLPGYGTTSSMDTITLAGTLEATLGGLAGVGAGNVTVSGSMAAGFTVVFQGALADTDMPEMTVDDSGLQYPSPATTINIARTNAGSADVGTHELQVITVDADGGQFLVNGQNVSYNSVPGLEASIEASLGRGVTIAGSLPGAATVSFDTFQAEDELVVADLSLTLGGGSGSVSIMTIQDGAAPSGGTSEIQTITLADSPDAGTWRVAGTGNDLAYNAGSSEVETQVEMGVGLGVGVTGSSGGPYEVTWDDHGSRSLLTADGANLTKLAAVAATVETTQAGAAEDATKPEVETATVGVGGDTLEVGLSETVTNHGGLTLNASGGAVTITYAAGNNSDTLSFAVSGRTIRRTETLTLDYAPGNIADASSNAMDAFADFPVDNNSDVDPDPAETAADDGHLADLHLMGLI